jgi:hypothetical protein
MALPFLARYYTGVNILMLSIAYFANDIYVLLSYCPMFRRSYTKKSSTSTAPQRAGTFAALHSITKYDSVFLALAKMDEFQGRQPLY